MRYEDLLNLLRKVAPESLAEAWDKVGVHLGRDDEGEINHALLCIDLTEAVADEAIAAGAGLIVAYHPPIFQPVTRLAAGPEATWRERMLRKLIRHDVGVYSPHTALDAVRGGINDWLCEGLGTGTSRPLKPTPAHRDELKVVVFVPEDEAATVRQAMSNAGAGWIGNYRECSFHVAGEGGFRPIEGATPTIGRVGTRETVVELRLEMICPRQYLPHVVEAICESHSYEEPAFDVFEQAPIPEVPEQATGAGRLLTLDEPVPRVELVQRVKARLGVEHVFAAGVQSREPVKTVAVCPGAGGSLFENDTPGADACLTGEMRHHDILDLEQRGRLVVLPGHTQTERPYLPTYRERLVRNGGEAIDWRISEADVPNPRM
ncbi:MAG: Nif3-like dinuclear metal center hexameric protein [Phycisphaeraceae bacterium]